MVHQSTLSISFSGVSYPINELFVLSYFQFNLPISNQFDLLSLWETFHSISKSLKRTYTRTDITSEDQHTVMAKNSKTYRDFVYGFLLYTFFIILLVRPSSLLTMSPKGKAYEGEPSSRYCLMHAEYRTLMSYLRYAGAK